MPYSRRILHYSPGPTDLVGEISAQVVVGCWFELHRQGGCGAGEITLRDDFADRGQIDVGDWIAIEYTAGDRWYMGRVRQRRAESPAEISLHLEGMGAELAEAFPGGFGSDIADGVPPHHYANTDLFPHDPDHDDETVDVVDEPHELVDLLLEQYVAPNTHIAHDSDQIEPASPAVGLTSAKFRGEESVRTILQDLAVRARNASWGVDETGTFFFLQPRDTLLASFREGVDAISLAELRDRDLLFNRVVLTGGIVYDPPDSSGVVTRSFYRWRGNYIQPDSRAEYGERRIRLWVPWIRTGADARDFLREFFLIYAEPPTRYLVEVGNQSILPRPWLGRVQLEDIAGNELMTAQVETVRVTFDHAPKLRMELGPVDPRQVWPEPPHADRIPLPHDPGPERGGGDLISLTSSEW